MRHSRRSLGRIGAARDALAIVYDAAQEFSDQVRQLCDTLVTEQQWWAFLDAHVPLRDEVGKPLEGRALGKAERKRQALADLYLRDLRVTPWAGTAFAVLQATSTYDHHLSLVRNGTRADRVAMRTITGELAHGDVEVWKSLQEVLAVAA